MARDDEILKRLDGHMERANEHMARGNEHMARGNELMQEVREEHRLNREAYERGTRLILDIVAQHEQAFRENMALSREIREELRKVHGRMEAQTQAIWAMLDRLGGNGGTAPA